MENNYQLLRIHNYVMGLMSREEMHVLEQEALEDPFLQDAIDGYKLQQGVDAKQLSLLQKRLLERVDQRALEKNRYFYSWQRLAVGMVAGMLFVVVCSLLLFKHFGNVNKEKMTEVILMEEDLRVNIHVAGDAVPVQGWELFGEELNSELRDHRLQLLAEVSFDVRNGQAVNVKVTNPKLGRAFVDTLVEFIRDKTKWEGTKGLMSISLSKK